MKWLWRVAGSRIISAIASFVVVKAAQRGITLDPIEITGAIVGLNGVIHKAVDSKLNKGDAATVPMANAENRAVDSGGTVTVSRKPY